MYLKLILPNTKSKKNKKTKKRKYQILIIEERLHYLKIYSRRRNEDEEQQTNTRKYSTINYANKEIKITERTNN